MVIDILGLAYQGKQYKSLISMLSFRMKVHDLCYVAHTIKTLLHLWTHSQTLLFVLLLVAPHGKKHYVCVP